MAKVFLCAVFTLISVTICVCDVVEKENDLDVTVIDAPTSLDENTLHINCKLNGITKTVQPWNKTISVEKVSLENCILPTQPLVEVFTTLNISTEGLKILQYVINDVNKTIERFPQANYMENMTLDALEIRSNNEHILANNPDFFEPLTKLKVLDVSGLSMPKLPLLMTLESMSLENSTLKNWGNCESLKTLKIKRMNTEQIPNSWPSKCNSLTSLTLEEVTEKTLQHLTSRIVARNLLDITITNSKLRDVPHKLLADMNGLVRLNLSNNNLEDRSLSKLPILQNLTSLDLSSNKLGGWFIVDLPSKLPAIQNLTLDGNRFVHIFRYFQIKTAIAQLTSLERLSMNRMLLDPDCLMSTQFTKLKYLSLASNEPIGSLLLQSLPSTNASRLEVDLRGRPVRTIPIALGDFQIGHSRNPVEPWPNKKPKLTLLVSYIDCDCNNVDLARILHQHPDFLSMPNLRCNQENGPRILQEPIDNLDCKKEKVDSCIRRTWDTNSIVDCSNLLAEELPWAKLVDKGVKGANVSGNYISSLQDIDFGELEWVDLRHNRLSRLQNSELAQLFALRSRRVWLAGNVIICDCDNRALLRMLHLHHTQVLDYDSLMCVDHDVQLSSLPVARVCRLGEGFVYGICCAGSVLTVILIILFRCCGGWLKTFMYARGLCINWFEDKDPDKDKIYDAFISFAHGDEAFVVEQLLPRLELTPEPFRVCVHYRDWVVGEWIPVQIMRSIRSSKRTIIVLSKHLAASWWGVLEFRYAHAHAMSEGRTRLLVLVLDDVLEQKLDPELQGYLSTNTFLRHDDPWFWDKLHYAMAHNTVRYY